MCNSPCLHLAAVDALPLLAQLLHFLPDPAMPQTPAASCLHQSAVAWLGQVLPPLLPLPPLQCRRQCGAAPRLQPLVVAPSPLRYPPGPSAGAPGPAGA